LIDGCVEVDVEKIESAKHKTELSARVTALDLDHPLAADADLLGEGRLIELELFAPVTNDSA